MGTILDTTSKTSLIWNLTSSHNVLKYHSGGSSYWTCDLYAQNQVLKNCFQILDMPLHCGFVCTCTPCVVPKGLSCW